MKKTWLKLISTVLPVKLEIKKKNQTFLHGPECEPCNFPNLPTLISFVVALIILDLVVVFLRRLFYFDDGFFSPRFDYSFDVVGFLARGDSSITLGCGQGPESTEKGVIEFKNNSFFAHNVLQKFSWRQTTLTWASRFYFSHEDMKIEKVNKSFSDIFI